MIESKFLYGAAVQGIQSFIFQTNELKNIVGASELVEKICTYMFKSFGKRGRIVVNAAGNVKSIFSNREDCENAVRCFPRVVMELHPMDMMKIIPEAERLLAGLEGDSVCINLTGGTKAWTIAFTLLAQGRNWVHLIYIDQNCVFYDYTARKKWLSAATLSMQQLMRLNGQMSNSYKQMTDYNDDDLDVLARVKALRKASCNKFNALTIPDRSWSRMLMGGNEGSHCLEDGSYIEWKKSTCDVHIVLRAGHRWLDEDTTSPNIMHIVFKSGWFEYEMAEMMNHWSHAKEVWLNVVYPYKAGQAKNEIDIVVNTGLKLLMLECKTQIFDNTDIDKFHTAVKNYGAWAVRPFLSQRAAKEKCADSQVMAFCMGDYAS